MASFFADSYAIIEILKGNENYRHYQAGQLITTEFNICEVAFAVCRDYPEQDPAGNGPGPENCHPCVNDG